MSSPVVASRALALRVQATLPDSEKQAEVLADRAGRAAVFPLERVMEEPAARPRVRAVLPTEARPAVNRPPEVLAHQTRWLAELAK